MKCCSLSQIALLISILWLILPDFQCTTPRVRCSGYATMRLGGMQIHDQLVKLSTAFNITRLFLSLANFETCEDKPHVTIQMNHFGRTFA